MTLQTLTAFFGWCTVINFALLLFTTVAVVTFRQSITGLHARLFGLNEQDLGRAYFQYLAQYKIAIIVFSLTPYVALKLLG